jgi:hypothetical protein
MQAKQLSELFSPGSTLSDVPPHYRGMPLKQWRFQMTQAECGEMLKTAALRTPEAQANELRKRGQAWRDRAVATPRDNYGWRSM